ncbi:DUF2235 domain-containing protein [Chryseobacterium sp.]|uniref:T6SS phospholipase effector Tle1-like catalytic domain-containing protein n=1 Tax=Chryseobacterium sp. TaxID=1871047 RepID=UPI0025C5EB80|nr:DUF2235 domain-containing protein [Chryseobacterium sp.]
MHNNRFGDYSPPPAVEDGTMDITLGMFFDGTLNNKTNTIERRNQTAVHKKHGGDPSDNNSYNNDWSNVARLWDNYDKNYAIYIEGIGTTDSDSDSMAGYAFGAGETGIRSKVEKGCSEIVKKVRDLKNAQKADKINVLTFDVFGFSRGAAAARHFVHDTGKSKYKATARNYTREKDFSATIYYDDWGNIVPFEELPKWGNLGLKLQQAGITVEILRIRFLGVYDTVSSYSNNGIPNFSNDVQELGLNDIGRAQTIVHFIAENEHRENFDLTRVPSGIEKTFPGVHCDVGGAYENGTETWKEIETAWGWGRIEKLEPLRRRLIAECWFNEDQLSYDEGKLYTALQGSRDLLKTFSYIPLHFMGEYGTDKDIPFNMAKITKETYSISSDTLLERVKARLRPYVMGNGSAYNFKTYEQLQNIYAGSKIPEQRHADYEREVKEQEDLRVLRNKYLHWSARREGIGMDPRNNRVRVIH